LKVHNVKLAKRGISKYLPSCYACILDLLHEDAKFPFLFAPQADHTETKAAPFWFEQLECNNGTHTPQTQNYPFRGNARMQHL
jgi:hypothetical protein